ncbi:Uncharacterised protein [Candidatus Ornithobacterium hominis]|uniref:Uncharacterized protein n=1 Tax=Candidatus Ornithobacterium hominis TaxID=2497989 RepID=A0A383U417_9FLAO|nr:hypothetical protein [Candidatus Ornithobacterium hominis]MCT7904748.1 hypothetical protein [Candidatus Ornithobacterium hominis]CAI9429876.1 Bacteriocin [Candidatus Ornithobacterium hominis]SZD73901.1 Uncharacterised protein [Candidatus Ornithobacterium hominis]
MKLEKLNLTELTSEELLTIEGGKGLLSHIKEFLKGIYDGLKL